MQVERLESAALDLIAASHA